MAIQEAIKAIKTEIASHQGEISKLEKALTALGAVGGKKKTRKKRAKKKVKKKATKKTKSKKTGRNPMSAAAKKKLSAAMKKRWAARKAGKK